MRNLILNLDEAYKNPEKAFEILIKKSVSEFTLTNLIPNQNCICYGDDSEDFKEEMKAHFETYKETNAISYRFAYFGSSVCHFFGMQGIFTFVGVNKALPNIWINLDEKDNISMISQKEMKRETLKFLVKKLDGTLICKTSINLTNKKAIQASQGTFIEIDRDSLSITNNPFEEFCVVFSHNMKFKAIYQGTKKCNTVVH